MLFSSLLTSCVRAGDSYMYYVKIGLTKNTLINTEALLLKEHELKQMHWGTVSDFSAMLG